MSVREPGIRMMTSRDCNEPKAGFCPPKNNSRSASLPGVGCGGHVSVHEMATVGSEDYSDGGGNTNRWGKRSWLDKRDMSYRRRYRLTGYDCEIPLLFPT